MPQTSLVSTTYVGSRAVVGEAPRPRFVTFLSPYVSSFTTGDIEAFAEMPLKVLNMGGCGLQEEEDEDGDEVEVSYITGEIGFPCILPDGPRPRPKNGPGTFSNLTIAICTFHLLTSRQH